MPHDDVAVVLDCGGAEGLQLWNTNALPDREAASTMSTTVTRSVGGMASALAINLPVDGNILIRVKTGSAEIVRLNLASGTTNDVERQNGW